MDKREADHTVRDLVKEAPRDAELIVSGLKKYFYTRRGFIEGVLKKPEMAVKAVNGVSFCLNEKETYGLVGESGCGKTTLGRLISRLLEPTDGCILYRPSYEDIEMLRELDETAFLDGFVNLSRLEKDALKMIRRQISMIFQDPYSSFDPRYTVKGVLEEPLLVHDVPAEERMGLIESVLEEVKLVPVEQFLWRHPHMLSGGQRQRLGVARALILKPTLVIADEPVSMLDVSTRAEVLELMMEQKRTRSLSYIFITHDLAVARYICDRITIMYLGKIFEEGPAWDVIDHPAHPYTRALVAAVPTPSPESRHRVKELPIRGEIPSPTDIPKGCTFNPRCPYAFEKCRSEEPPWIEVDRNHHALCWLAGRL